MNDEQRNEIDRKMARIHSIIDRIEWIGKRQDWIQEKLYKGDLPVQTFVELYEEWTNLSYELDNKRRELRQVHKIKF